MTNALQIYTNFDTIQRTATALYNSGYFKDAGSQAQAIVKVMAGAELGLPPFASMAGIHIVQGKPVLGSNVVATLVKNDPRYDYRVKVSTDTECVLTWYEDGKVVGESSFTMVEAQNAGLTGKAVWKQYPSDLLFARAVTRGARRFAPGVFGGSPVYTPEELNVDVDEDGYIEGEVVEHHGDFSADARALGAELGGTPVVHVETPPAPRKRPQNGGGKLERPLSPEDLRDSLRKRALGGEQEQADEKKRLQAVRNMAQMFGEENRHMVMEWLFDKTESVNLTDGECEAIRKWVGWTKDDQENWLPNDDSVVEAQAVVRQVMLDNGQLEFELDEV
jgi:hypothetical protein